MNFKQTALCPYLIIVLVLFTSPTPPLYADISTDGTVGAAQTLTGPDYTIPETLGKIKGDNLFHSFERFSIKTQESATFTGSDSIKNVISRVTGGEKSEIDGTLRSNVGKADFYFVNPSGVVFGENAKVDVPSAFHVSTADELKFKDGASFKASKSQTSTLTQAAPEAFGFLEAQSASIEINGSTLEFKPESKVSLTSSKDITIEGSSTKQAILINEAGEINLKANSDLLIDNAQIRVSGNGGGNLNVKACNATLQNKSNISANNTGDKNSYGSINVDVDKQLEFRNSSYISNDTWSKGDAGSVKIKAGSMKINGQGSGVVSIATQNSEGKAGKITIIVDELLELLNVGQVLSSTFGKGDAGSVIINAGNMLIDGQVNSGYFTGIESGAESYSEGNAGEITINIDGLLELFNGAEISSNTFSKGDAGSVKINAANMVIDRQNSTKFTGVASNARTGSEGNAGTVDITITELLELLQGGQISSTTFSKGDAGSVKIKTGNMTIDRQGSSKFTGVVSSTEDTNSEGNAGEITINIYGLLELLNGAEISSSTWSKGNAGSVKINAGNMIIDGQESSKITGIASNARTDSEGNAGEITITVVEMLELVNGGSIGSSTWSKGEAGSIKINSGNIKIDGMGNSKFTGIASSADKNSEGKAGTVEITVIELMELLNAGQILSSTFAKGDAGSVKINAENMRIDGQGSNKSTGVASSAEQDSEGNAGTVEITASELIELLNGTKISSSTWSKGDAGNVKIDTNHLIVDSSSIKSDSADIASGYVGNITVNANSIKLMNKSNISIGAYQTLSEEKVANMPDKAITLNTKQLNIESESRITSESTENVPASDININGCAIFLHDGMINTSVTSTKGGDGGNISINKDTDPADFLIMSNGYMQANTKAEGSRGGLIRVNAGGLIADKSIDFKIGGEEESFNLQNKKNVIQAADPSKNPQDIQAPNVPIDIGGSIINSGAQFIESVQMAENYCSLLGTGRESSLTLRGRGGFPESIGVPGTIYYSGKRLDELLKYEIEK